MAKDDECAVQVSGLAANVDDGVLMNVFRSHGRVVRIKRDEFNGAHIVFTSKSQANKATKAMNGATVEGKAITAKLVPKFKKTMRPCRGFQAGICRKGDACKYYHQKPDEVAATTQKAVAIPTIKSAASLAKAKAEASAAAAAPAPAPVHTSTVSVTVDGVPNRIMCRHFARGFCSLGETCRFAHVQGGGQQAAPSFNIEAVKKTRPCLYFASGVCSRGDQCLFIHETPATQPAATSAPASTPKTTKKTTPIVQSTSQVTQNEESDSESEDDNNGDDDLRVCIECEKPGVARWVCGKCDKALYCDDCNAAVHRSKVMSKHKRALLPPPAVKKEKCGECEEADADVKCEQCEVVYCSACDTSVHKFKSLRKHTRVPIDGNASEQPTKEKKQQKKKAKNEPSNSNSTPAMETKTTPFVTAAAAAAAASKFAPEPVAIPQSAKDAAKTFVESVPQMDFSSDSDSDSASDDDSDADDNSDNDASSDVQPSSTHQPTPIPVHRPAPVTEISSESSDDDEEMAPAQAKPAAAKKTTPVQTSSRAAVPAGDESDASSESDFDDVRPTNLQSASVAKQAKTLAMQAKTSAVQADSSSSSSSESESDDDEEVKPSPPPVAARAPTKSHAPRANANRKAGISDGSSHTLVKKIEAYYESGNAEALHLDANLNAFERLLAHDCAERLGLQHVSVGEGLERHITISHGAIGAAASSNKRPSELKSGKEAKRRKNH